MKFAFRPWICSAVVSLAVFVVADAATAASAPSAADALKLVPTQRDVDYARPTAEEAAKCRISPQKLDGRMGWVVEDAAGMTLRRFVDSNDDNVVDRWSYFKDGLEVYRDLDVDYDGQVDQCRWFHTGGSRWGLDTNEDGKIDAWKAISAEEVTAEAVAALAAGDAARFTRLMLTSGELASLGLGKEKAAVLAKQIGAAETAFRPLATSQKVVTSQSRWVQFSGLRPGIVPSGTDGSAKDLRVYENVTAIVQTGEKHGQVYIGTLVEVGDVWRLIDVPRGLTGDTADVAAGFFFRPPIGSSTGTGSTGPSGESQKLLADLEALDRESQAATTPAQLSAFAVRRSDLLAKLAKAAGSAQEREVWLRQLADMLSAGTQDGTLTDGVTRLGTLLADLKAADADRALVPYVLFRKMTAEYIVRLRESKDGFAEIQSAWLKGLEQFVADYPTSPDAAEAMLQLATSREFAGQEDDAKKWYARIVSSFPGTPVAQKAAGAQTRLDLVGKTLSLSGKTPSGGLLDLAKYRGRVVVVQYWATWSDRAKADMPTLKALMQKYGSSLSVIGVNLDASVQDVTKFVTQNSVTWPQIHEEGGLDSRPANQFGILTLPTMFLIDKQGKVVSRNVQTVDLDGELKKLIR